MKLVNINKTWKAAASNAILEFQTHGSYTKLHAELTILNPYASVVIEYEGYRNWITENINAAKEGDITRLSTTSSNSILNSTDDEDVQDEKKTYRKGRTLLRPGGMERMQPDIDDLCRKANEWIENLVHRYTEFHEFDEPTCIDIPEDMRRSFRVIGLQTKEHVGGYGSGSNFQAVAVDADGIIIENGKHIAWEDIEGETSILEVVYYLDEILLSLFTKTPQGIIEKILNETYGDMTASGGDSNKTIASKICKDLFDAKFLDRL